jgi:low affinity Fe/Cu permease
LPDDDNSNHVATQVGPDRSWFDHFADRATGIISHGPFFVFAAGYVLVWLALALTFGFSHGWTDALNLPAVTLTVLMVALLENEQRRSDQAVQRKLNTMAEALADFLEKQDVDPRHVEELRAAVSLEERESTPKVGR